MHVQAPTAKAGATSSQALSPDAFAATSKVTEPASFPDKASLPADTGCTSVSKQTSVGEPQLLHIHVASFGKHYLLLQHTYFWSHTGDASSAKVTPAPAKRRKLLVLGSSKDIKVQQTFNQTNGSPPAGAKSVADDGPTHCKNAASSMPKVQKTHKSKPKSGTPRILGESLAC